MTQSDTMNNAHRTEFNAVVNQMSTLMNQVDEATSRLKTRDNEYAALAGREQNAGTVGLRYAELLLAKNYFLTGALVEALGSQIEDVEAKTRAYARNIVRYRSGLTFSEQKLLQLDVLGAYEQITQAKVAIAKAKQQLRSLSRDPEQLAQCFSDAYELAAAARSASYFPLEG